MSIEETLLQKVGQQAKQIGEVKEDVRFIRKELFGNGKVGLDEEVRKNSSFRRDFKKFIWLIIVAMVSQSALLLYSIIAVK